METHPLTLIVTLILAGLAGFLIWRTRNRKKISPAPARTPARVTASGGDTPSEDFLNRAIAALRSGQTHSATGFAEEGLRSNPGNRRVRASLLNVLGNAQVSEKNYDAGERWFREAADTDPAFSFPHSNLGNLYFIRGRFEEAESAYREALRLDPHYADAYNNLGTLYKKEQRIDEAVHAFEKALELNPGMEGVRRNLDYLKRFRKE
ncbi:MAG: hypothetical protein COV67_01750 [Nitrospinae bacterium CG11_big_fil_rev_8_21_14_0_20_56_8]|nr:MAG: hypothetical protein COV67_01750 [Nitrospinae bacterium CG11_big_fil_rev_8_21_14_0_20_56_8]